MTSIDPQTLLAILVMAAATMFNRASGFFLMLPRADVIELNMSVDQALTYVISMGSVAPASH